MKWVETKRLRGTYAYSYDFETRPASVDAELDSVGFRFMLCGEIGRKKRKNRLSTMQRKIYIHREVEIRARKVLFLLNIQEKAFLSNCVVSYAHKSFAFLLCAMRKRKPYKNFVLSKNKC